MTNFKAQKQPLIPKTDKLPTIEKFFALKVGQLCNAGTPTRYKCTFKSSCTHEAKGECNHFIQCNYQKI